MRLIVMSINCWSGLLVKRLVALLIWETNEKVIKKVPIEETIRRRLGNESLEDILCILEFVRAWAQPEEINITLANLIFV